MTPLEIFEWFIIYITGLIAFTFTFLIVLGVILLIKEVKKVGKEE